MANGKDSPNGTLVVIAEKPSVAKLIASALDVKKTDVAKGLDCYENENFVITSAVGHLVEYEKPKKKWSLDALPLNGPGELIPIARSKSKLTFINKLLKRKDIVGAVNACDAGREGELIFNQIINYLKIKIPCYRAWMQSMTKKEIKKEFDNLKPADDFKDLANAALGRTIADWKIGMNGTRAMTAWSSKAYNVPFNKQVVGRVKTPTLTLVVLRDEEVDKFIPSSYHELEATFKVSSGEYKGTYIDKDFNNKDFTDEEKRTKKSDRIFQTDKAENIINSCNKKVGEISESSKERKEYSGALYDLTTLQRESNSRFGFTANSTLKIVQSLYQPISGEGYITYPRTDSRRLPNDHAEEVNKLLNVFGQTEYSKHSKYILENNLLKPENKKIFDSEKVSDHFAIIPTQNIPNLSKLNEQQLKLYDLIVKRFFAVFYPPAITLETIRDTVVEGNIFRTSGRILIEKGWKEVLDNPVQDKLINTVEPNEEAKVINIERINKETIPKARYTDATLLRGMETAGNDIDDDELMHLMKNKGIGTPATRAEIIEQLIRETYLFRTEDDNGKKCITSSTRGKKLIEDLQMLKIDQLTSATLTGEWELKLREIEKDKYSYEEFIEEIEKFRDEIIDKAKNTKVDTDEFIKKLGINCPIKNLPMFETFNRYTTDLPDESTNINKVISGRPIAPSEAIELIKSYNGNEGRIRLTGFISRFGSSYDADVVLTSTGKYKLDWGQDEQKKINLKELESLGHSSVVDSEVYYDNDYYYYGKNGKNRLARRMLSPYLNSEDEEERKKDSLPIEEAEKLFKDGKTSVLQFKSKRKNARMPFFKAKVYLDSKFRPRFEMELRKKPTKKSKKLVQ
tara:strand:- start:1768 stop:4332 length:2565 start_codon:yes stop_codon:yes gene_type:complete